MIFNGEAEPGEAQTRELNIMSPKFPALHNRTVRRAGCHAHAAVGMSMSSPSAAGTCSRKRPREHGTEPWMFPARAARGGVCRTRPRGPEPAHPTPAARSSRASFRCPGGVETGAGASNGTLGIRGYVQTGRGAFLVDFDAPGAMLMRLLA